MDATKRCAWGTSKNDSRYPQRMIKNSNGDLVTFFRFPGPKKNAEKRMRWIVHVGAVIIFNITAQRTVYTSADFVGEKVQYQQHGVKSWKGFYACCVYL
jgi:hypothetical protein